MGLLSNKDKLASLSIANPRDVFINVLKQASGSSQVRELKYNIFYQIYAFQGITEGVGTSTLVANVAMAIAKAGLTVCVIDTSIMHPVQDVLLNTEVSVDSENTDSILDWFDMPYTKKSPLHISKLNRNISVLSFKGKHRGVVDFLSTNDSSSLVEIALTELHNKFDIILIDACHEMSAINTTCLQMSQQIIQVWNDSPTVISNLNDYITNAMTLSCPLDKMRFVVYSKICKDVIGSLDELIKQYRLKHIATSYISEEVSLLLVTGKTLFQVASVNELVIEYTNCVIDIACHILNIHNDAKGTITSNEIMNGEVEGTYHKELKDFNEEFQKLHPDVVIDRNPMGYTPELDEDEVVEDDNKESDDETVTETVEEKTEVEEKEDKEEDKSSLESEENNSSETEEKSEDAEKSDDSGSKSTKEKKRGLFSRRKVKE